MHYVYFYNKTLKTNVLYSFIELIKDIMAVFGPIWL